MIQATRKHVTENADYFINSNGGLTFELLYSGDLGDPVYFRKGEGPFHEVKVDVISDSREHIFEFQFEGQKYTVERRRDIFFDYDDNPKPDTVNIILPPPVKRCLETQ